MTFCVVYDVAQIISHKHTNFMLIPRPQTRTPSSEPQPNYSLILQSVIPLIVLAVVIADAVAPGPASGPVDWFEQVSEPARGAPKTQPPS